MVFQAFAAWRFRERLGPLKPIFDLIFQFYFILVRFAFWIINQFIEKKIVPPPSEKLTLISATNTAKLIRERKLKSEDIVQAYINRIKECNPITNAVVYEHFEEALGKAREVDKKIEEFDDIALEEYTSSRPLLGLPFTMKDTIKAKGKHLTVGVVAWKDYIADENAIVVQRMLNAGAILLAQTNVPQCALWTESVNALFGRSNNPYDSRRNVGGSSGGEGALQGSAGSLMGIGSDIGGSIRIPSFYNGVFGFVPTSGVIPLEGHIPAAYPDSYKAKMARIGPMTRFAQDLPLLMSVLAAPERPFTFGKNLKRVFYSKGIENCKLMEPLNETEENVFRKAVDQLEKYTNRMATQIFLKETELAIPHWFVSFRETEEEPLIHQIMTSPMADGESVNCWKELIKFAFGKSDHILAVILEGLGDSRPLFGVEERKRLIESRDRLRQGLIDLLGNDGILVWPGQPTEAPFHNEYLFKQSTCSWTWFWNTMAFPVVQCPMGLSSEGLPTGVQIIAAPGSDNLLLEAAMEISEAFGGWVPPGKF